MICVFGKSLIFVFSDFGKTSKTKVIPFTVAMGVVFVFRFGWVVGELGLGLVFTGGEEGSLT